MTKAEYMKEKKEFAELMIKDFMTEHGITVFIKEVKIKLEWSSRKVSALQICLGEERCYKPLTNCLNWMEVSNALYLYREGLKT